jgi:alkanesulfonate monooxygenase SsuD/methylene tetrahydromethanopterin reductase-like flavin-dependent oxidoreductase (luciferase family)
VKGPSITPRPPQGQPVVAVLAHHADPIRLAARSADVVFVTPRDAADARRLVTEVRSAESDVDRSEPLRVFADLVVFLGPDAGSRLSRLDETAGAEFRSDAHVFTGTAAELADLLTDWQAAGIEGFRLRPGTLPHDLRAIVDDLVPLLGRPDGYAAPTLRGILGLPRPANRYATT